MLDKNIVIHTAAIKYVPDAEFNVAECIRVNVLGTQNVCMSAAYQMVEKVVFISTDKACQPVNVYGMTKALGERTVSEAARWWTDVKGANTRYTFTRYGNVIGSTGSVIPVFKQQLRDQGYITVTDPFMTRFWMTIDEAVDCILEALGCESGCGVIPKARAMKMGELAAAIAGTDGRKDSLVKVTGVRPGEKMHETLVHEQESVRASDCGSKLYYFLQPVGYPPSNHTFEYKSSAPYEWLTIEDLLEAAEDAESV
jgi:UDP-N-acetylglucosamine 4,6-dehydratase